MKTLLVATLLLPLIGSILLMLFSERLRANQAAIVGCTTVGVAATMVVALGWYLITQAPGDGGLTVDLGTWFSSGGFTARASLRLDALSLVMAFVVTFVGFFIHLYSSEYMAGEEGEARYFSWLNLFIAAMLLLVLADDLTLLYAGWEGVGLCSYLLIGFWFKDPRNGYAARKAFVMTRFGDALLLVGLLLLATRLGSLQVEHVVSQARALWMPGDFQPTLIAFLLLGGALGKSAQVPLHTWLPDAMAGPTPVSALIHAATMVTAGVYFIARLHGFFVLAPLVQQTTAIIGAVTLLLGALSALAQNDIKRVLAYSTVSQIGYMFLALGLGAWSAAIFHFLTHAFFKALLFLGAGAVILALNHEQDIRKMGGLRRRLPLAFWSFVAGGASLAAMPLVTAGFFSKELILTAAWASPVLWSAAWVGAILTGAYVTRLIVRVFLTSQEHTAIHHHQRWTIDLPLWVLAAGALGMGFLDLPEWMNEGHVFTTWLAPLLGNISEKAPFSVVLAGMAAPFLGAALWWSVRRLVRGASAESVTAFLREGVRVDALYARLVERPWNGLVQCIANEPADGIYDAMSAALRRSWRLLSLSQNGVMRRYVGAVAVGTILILLAAS